MELRVGSIVRSACAAAAIVSAALLAPAATAQSLFDPVAEVLKHPRCLNCHTVTEFPRQGDERRRHDQLVMRGADGHGVPTLQCSACHQGLNVDHARVPGAPNWHLAPLSMAWERLGNSEICAQIKDRARNGNHSVAEIAEHMRSDPLVLWAWNPGVGRNPPPVSQPEFVRRVDAWMAAGAPCGP